MKLFDKIKTFVESTALVVVLLLSIGLVFWANLSLPAMELGIHVIAFSLIATLLYFYLRVVHGHWSDRVFKVYFWVALLTGLLYFAIAPSNAPYVLVFHGFNLFGVIIRIIWERHMNFTIHLVVLTMSFAFTFLIGSEFSLKVIHWEVNGVMLLLSSFLEMLMALSVYYAFRDAQQRGVEIQSEITQVNQVKDWYADAFGMVSHNLKTPLAIIANELQIAKLKSQSLIEISPDQFDKIFRSIDTMKELMGEFISIQRRIISKGDKETTLHEFLEELSRPMEISVGNHCSQRVIVSESDAFTLSLALHVFIDNAKKYAGGLPEISIQPNGNIRVRDYGPGLSIDEIKKMGREIMRKESSFQGQGMGVYFAIGLLKKSGWTVEIRNASPGLQIDLIKRERKD